MEATSQSPAMLAAMAAKREAVGRALLGLHKVLIFFAMPVVLAVYLLQLYFWPSWQFAVVFGFALAGCLSWFGSRRLAEMGKCEASASMVFASVWVISVVAALFRQHTIPMAELSILASLVVLWLGNPPLLLVAGPLSLVSLLALRVIAFYGWVPVASSSPLLEVVFDAGVSSAVFVAFVMLLRAGATASQVPFARLGRTFDAVLSVQPVMRGLTESVRTVASTVATGAQQQAAAAQQVAASAGSLETSLVRTGTATTEARAIANSTKESSSAAWEGLQRVGERLEQYLKDMESVVGIIGNLAQRSERTEDVIKTIEDVNTGLTILSVNAALEATRAGESGRAIGIIADKMNGMIGQTTGSLRQGKELLVAIRRDAASAARETTGSSAELRKHLEELHQAARAMRHIIDSFNQTSENISVIAEASVSQREQIEAVKLAADDLSSSAVDLNRSAGDLVDSAQKMGATQGQLESVVAQHRNGDTAPAQVG